MEPCFAPTDKQMFYKYLEKATNYFEFGSGGSTYQAATRPTIQHIYSVESDFEWHAKLKDILHDKSNITFIYNEMDTRPNTWGNPGPKSTETQWKEYSNHIAKGTAIDFILIDGRFRVACCLKCFEYITDTCLIAFDDFLNRPQYHVVLEYYDIIEQTSDTRMVILKKKSGISKIPLELITKYEVIKD
jgi:protein O-GlcNAc transferase